MSDFSSLTFQFVQKFGNEYAATMYAAQQARNLLTLTHNALTESEAIDWLVSCKPESELKEYIKKCNPRIINRKYSLINDFTANIDDSELKDCFQDSAIKSMKARKLVINYKKLDAANCARLRILLKQYWLEYLENELPDATLHLT